MLAGSDGVSGLTKDGVVSKLTHFFSRDLQFVVIFQVRALRLMLPDVDVNALRSILIISLSEPLLSQPMGRLR
jgi:hypothetical protein